jgi:hypothetical protein
VEQRWAIVKRIDLFGLALSRLAYLQKRDDIIKVLSSDAEMNAAIAAQRTLPEFWDARKKNGSAFSGLLKVYFEDAGTAEAARGALLELK